VPHDPQFAVVLMNNKANNLSASQPPNQKPKTGGHPKPNPIPIPKPGEMERDGDRSGEREATTAGECQREVHSDKRLNSWAKFEYSQSTFALSDKSKREVHWEKNYKMLSLLRS